MKLAITTTQAAHITPTDETAKVSVMHSIRMHILSIVVTLFIVIALSFTVYTISQFKQLTQTAIKHEGLLLADIIGTEVKQLAINGNVRQIQSLINALVEARPKNDIEINVAFLVGEDQTSSDIIASNVPDNIEATDPEEHQEIMKSIANRAPFVSIETEDDELEEDDEIAHRFNPEHPDYYFPVGHRSLNITVPLINNNQPLGGINIKLSLSFLDQKLAAIYQNIANVLFAGLVILIVGISLYLNRILFRPLVNIAQSIYRFGVGENIELADSRQNNELGLITGEFKQMMKRIKTAEAMNLEYQNHLEVLVNDRTQEVMLTQETTMIAMGALAETRDPETGGHIKRTQNYVKCLAEHMSTVPHYTNQLTPENIDSLYKSAPLHDIGKVGIADEILLKPGKLTDDEFEIMKTHTTLGGDALLAAEKKLGSNHFLKYAREIAYTHQEKWDGSGYPQGLKGNDIPLSGRLMAVADVYDALISKRCYKPAFSHEKAVQIIIEGKGRHFDPQLVEAFIELQEDFRQIALEYADNEEHIH